MASGFERKTDSMLEATLLCPEGVSSNAILNDILQYNCDEPVGTIALLWDVKHTAPNHDEKYFFVNAAKLVDGSIPTFQIDPMTVPIPISKSQQGRVKLLELFAGGYGGWSSASKFMTEMQGVDFHTIAVEKDQDAAFSYAVSRNAMMWNGNKILPKHALDGIQKDVILCADVHCLAWVPCVASWAPDVMCVSSPCPAWSGAGNGQGLCSEDGECMMQSIALAKLLRPKFLLIEQVAAFMSHPHKAHVFSLLRWAGYCLKWNKIVDLSEQCPTSRCRWLGLAIRVAVPVENVPTFQYWEINKEVVPSSYGSILQHDLTLDDRLRLTDDMIRLAARPDLLPPAKRRCVQPQDTLKSRCFSKNQVLPTFMAAYGHQHEFAESWLAGKGLLCHFFQDEDVTRLWHPIEVILHHGMWANQFVHNNWRLAWQHVGNQISVPHALLLLTNMMRVWKPHENHWDVGTMLDAFRKRHVTADALCIVKCAQGHILSREPIGWTAKQFDNIDAFYSCLVEGELPPNLAWSIDGLHKIDETIDMIMTLPSAAERSHEIQSTIPFYATATATFTSGRSFFEFEYDPALSNGRILGIWENTMVLCDDADSQIILQPNPKWQEEIEEAAKALILVTKTGVKILQPDRTSLTKAMPSCEIFFDQFGPVTQTTFDASMMVFDRPPCPSIPEWKCTAARFVMAMSQCQTYVKLDTTTHAVSLIFQGPQKCVEVIVDMWNHVLSMDFLKLLGLQKSCRKNKVGAILILHYDEGVCPVPFAALKVQLVVLAARVLFDRMQDPMGVPVKLKWLARPLWQGKLPRNFTGASILQVLQAATFIHTGVAKFRMICKGQRFLDEQKVDDLPRESHAPATIHTVLQLQGGGIPTTKQGVKIQSKNNLAGVLLAEGYDLRWVGTTLDDMVDKIPVKELTTLAGLPPGPQKVQKLLEVIKQCDIQVPKIKPQLTSSAASNARRKKQQAMPHPDDYIVAPGALLNEDGSEATQTQEFGCHITGFYIATQAFAFQWLKAGDKIATDELAMLILGDLPVPTTLPTNKVTLPFHDDKGRDVLIACHLVQFGDKRILPKQLDQHLIASDNTSLMAITLWKHDWEEQWSTVCQNPYKFVRAIAGAEELIVSIWGKSFRKGKQPTSANDSTSVQMHCLLRSDKMSSFLARSGYNLVWLTPKTEGGKLHDMWKLIWLERDCDIQQATVIGARISDSAGLVQSNSRYAIRVPASNFENDWAIVYPNLPVPESKDTSMTFKLQSLPFGTTKDMLTAWSQHIQWDFKPLRALGPRAWIVGAGRAPDNKQYAFNGLPVLIQEIQSKHHGVTNPIVAGPKPGPKKESRSSEFLANGLFAVDPWGSYTGPKPAHVTTTQPTTARATAGPTADRLAQQDDKIANMQKALNQLQENQIQRGHIMEKFQEDATQRDGAIRAHVDQQLKSFKKDLDNSFALALNAQSQQFEHSLNEIKGLLLDRQKRKSPEEDDADMRH